MSSYGRCSHHLDASFLSGSSALSVEIEENFHVVGDEPQGMHQGAPAFLAQLVHECVDLCRVSTRELTVAPPDFETQLRMAPACQRVHSQLMQLR